MNDLLQKEWLEVKDPLDEKNTWVFDITFLLSNWNCIFGRGCKGIYDIETEYLNEGCCSHGAHFHDENDKDNVIRAAQKLDADVWQHIDIAKNSGISQGEDDSGQTRLVDDACIFLNRVGFKTGPGCAFHFYAEKNGIDHTEVKPMVCWQLPIAQEIHEDENGCMTTKITEYTRESWGEGGEDFAWWCTEDPNAFTGESSVYISMKSELTKIVGSDVYEQLSDYLATRTSHLPHQTQKLVQISKKY